MKKHYEVLQELHDLYEAKNHDYGDSFHQTYQKYGVSALMIRLHDKFARLEKLSQSEAKVTDETFRNTLIDLVNYGVMGLMEMDEDETKKPVTPAEYVEKLLPSYPKEVQATLGHIRQTGGTIVGVNCKSIPEITFGNNGSSYLRYEYEIEYVNKNCPSEVLTMHINV